MKNFTQTILFFSFILSVGCSKKDHAKITVATAANMQFAIQEIVKSFTKQTGISCDIVIGSSGKLTAQIKEGAPYDIFISADTKYPKALYTQGFATSPPEIYAHGSLILWSISDTLRPNLKFLDKDYIQHIALANPKTAPYGEAAIAVLKHYDIYPQIQNKLVYGESISQTNQFIVSGAAQVGFTTKSVVLSPQMKGKGNWISIPKNSYTPIAQAVILIQKEKVSKNATKFYEYLFSLKSKEILENFGYLVTEK